MSYVRRAVPMVYVNQPDAYLSQANPVSTTLYPVLANSQNVRIICMEAHVTWGVTQPTPMYIVMVIDGVTITYSVDNPVSGSIYWSVIEPHTAATAQILMVRDAGDRPRLPSFLIEGRNISVSVGITWGITQPTPLVCRVKWAQLQ